MATKKQPEWLKENDDYSLDVTLSRPAELGGVKQSVVRMREPTVADQEAVSVYKGTDAAREITAFANLCDLAPDDIRKLPMRDYKRLQAAYEAFTD